ncbi:MAG: DUF342 domain-containing protein [Rhodocyclales bacterium]|nr:DUF342 domain-containing protein [Rhodocyclales bacterium]
MNEKSVIGTVADLTAGQILLPPFVLRQDDGLVVDLTALNARGLMAQFVERVFAAGARFVDLDYEVFLNLVFLWSLEDIAGNVAELRKRGRHPRLRLARDVVAFPEERRGIYRSVKLDAGGKSAEFMFEQISVEREEADGATTDGSGTRKVKERLYADFDEFVAALWTKGVRFGIDAKAVRDAIARDQVERLVFAKATVPSQGKDAGIDEQTDLLHRDDAPRLLSNGRMDLRQYRNRFPQVTAGTRLFKKLPRLGGRSGWDVQGRELEPVAVKDFDIETLAGPGTRVLRDGGVEFVVAAKDGFLDIDANSGQISVVDKIVSRAGVSMRTTGDLSLAGDDYEEHGEVQEKRAVEGHNMTFFADVYGNLLSDGGCITVKRSIASGSARSPGGRIVVADSASRATLEALGGEVTAARAESCLIVAARVVVGRAVSCDIVADEVEIEQCEGCAIAAKKVVLKSAGARKDEATAVTLLLPDLSRLDKELAELEKTRAKLGPAIDQRKADLQALTAHADMKRYMSIQPLLKAKTLVMNPTQQGQWETLLDRVAPLLRRVAQLTEELKPLRADFETTEQEIAALEQARDAAARGISCEFGEVTGDARAHTYRPDLDAPPLSSLPAKDLHRRLREIGNAGSRLFSASGGSFSWQPPAGAFKSRSQ